MEEALICGNLLGCVQQRVLLLLGEGGGAPGDQVFVSRIEMGFEASVKGLLNVETYVNDASFNFDALNNSSCSYSWFST